MRQDNIYFLSCICFLLGISSFSFRARAGDLAYELPVQTTYQSTGVWCWAASSLALLNRYDIYPGVTIEADSYYDGDCLIASKQYMLPGDPEEDGWFCCAYPEACTQGATFRGVETVLEDYYGLDMATSLYPLSQTTLADIVKTQKKPVIAWLDLSSTSWDHIVLIVGVNTTGSEVEYMDPMDGSNRKRSYSSLISNGQFQWVASMYPTASPPDDVVLRYSNSAEWDSTAVPPKVGWNYIALGKLTAGSDYVVTGYTDPEFVSGQGHNVVLEKTFMVEDGALFNARSGL